MSTATRHALLVTLLAGCATDPVAPGPPYRAEVLEMVDSDPDTGVSRFEIVERELTRLDDLDRLEGPELAVRRGGKLIVRELNGSVIIDGRFEAPEDPELRYAVEDGAVIPLDYPTLTMLSAYHQFSLVLDQVEAVAGISVEELVDRVGQMEAFFEPHLVMETDIVATGTAKLNAFYMPQTKQFGLAQRAGVEGVPLAANPKVIAHEFGHALFDQLFYDGTSGLCDEEEIAADPLSASRLSTEYAVSGFNEGTGDFISFAMTASPSVLQEMLSPELAYLVVDDRSLLEENFVYDDLTGEDPDCGGFYCIGTLWARSLHAAYRNGGGDPSDAGNRAGFAREVLTALRTTRATMAEQGLMPPPTATSESCDEVGRTVDHDNEVISAFLAAFLVNVRAESRPRLCRELADRFGEAGFSAEARAAGGCEEAE